MATYWNRWVGRRKNTREKRKSLRRRLLPETLETRQLLAANVFHNELMPEDVNEDGIVSAVDALTIINEMGRQSQQGDVNGTEGNGEARGIEQRGRGRMTDVNNDGRDTALDALMVINRLSRDQGRANGQRPDTGGATQPDVAPTPDTTTPTGEPGQNTGQDETPRSDRPRDEPRQPDVPTDDTGVTPSEVRSIDGTGNNLVNPELGSADTALLRVAENDYADGISEPAGEDRPSAREISNTLFAADPDGTTSERDLTSFVFAWGQFLDHDIDLSLEPEDEADVEAFDIEVPTGDPLFDPFATGEQTISLTRSAIADGSGTSIDNPAEQVNAITAWIDGSQVYGSDQETSDSLREFVGGRLLITDDGLLPTDEDQGLLAGDIRAAENAVLTSMHALFLREHNRLADEISAGSPGLTDEEIFQEARSMVVAEMQSITVNEYLPALLGEDALSRYQGYDESVDPTIANEFSTAAFRFGHSTLNDEFRFVGNDGNDIDEPITLANAFFQPELLEESGIDSLLKYASSTLSQEIDLEVVDSLRNFLFGPPGAGGLDLVSLNIQRGRDHGLADYNAVREAYGLAAVESFDQITSDVDVQANLASLYGDVNNIDLWVGLMAEDHTETGSLGETATTIIADQFERLRDGDRFWYENVLDNREVREIENTSLADIIERNTNIDSLQENVFFFAPEITGSVVARSVADDQAAPGGANGEQVLGNQADRGVVNDIDLDLLARDQVENRRGRGDRVDPDTPQRPDGQDGRGAQSEPMVGVVVELLDSEGNLVDTALTDAAGNYRFTEFDESGAYTIQMAASDEYVVDGASVLDVQIASGDESLRGMDFRVLV